MCTVGYVDALFARAQCTHNYLCDVLGVVRDHSRPDLPAGWYRPPPNSVAVIEGNTSDTAMPSAFSSWRDTEVSMLSAAFVAAYLPTPGNTMRVVPGLWLTIRPEL